MNPATLEKLRRLCDRHIELGRLLSQPHVIGAQEEFRKLSKELAEIAPLVEAFDAHQQLARQHEETQAMCADDDAAIRQMAEEELPRLTDELAQRETALRALLAPSEQTDARNIFLEIRAGAGGDEAALFAGDLAKMYFAYAERMRWKVEVLSQSEGEHGGYKEVISRIEGARVYARLKFESGAHRVQRVPLTESQGRVHTSACTVAVMPEADDADEVEINSNEVRIDRFRASGAGGQHVNKTDSAIRLTHLPSGIVVECQDQRSQHKNRARAFAVLKARLLEAQNRAKRETEASMRKSLVGSGDRSERIRTYNFPQGRVTDHRIGLTLYKLEDILGGGLEQVVEPLCQHQIELLERAE